MKAKIKYLSSILILIGSSLEAQSVDPSKVKRIIYVNTNLSIISPSLIIARASLVREFKNSFGLSLGLAAGFLKNESKPKTYTGGLLCIYGCGEVKVWELNFMLSKIFLNKSKKYKFGLDFGPSLEYFKILEFKTNEKSFWTSLNYDICLKQKISPGLSIRTQLQFIPKRMFGLTVGATLNYNSDYKYLGFDIGYLFGRLKNKG